MPTLYSLKPRFQALLRPLVKRIADAGISANQITLLAAIISAIAGAGIIWSDSRQAFLILPVWFLLRMGLNAIDGMLAREFGQKSTLGAYLNELCDVVADAALIAPFALVAPFAPAWVFAVIFLAALSEYAGVMGPLAGAGRRYDGPFGKSDRALVIGALGMWVGIGGPLPPWTAWIMPVLALLLAVTVLNRVRNGVAEAAASSKEPQ
ncbi:CDP-alcohol phosphatidyltransferase family protein [Sphingomonas sp.]|uniref:CDP-alcohol phosphatidyltransferase family protein n=1 Tax=Sphingomonas sp. TaxID=28214 RepID=UPI003B3AF7C6